MLLELGGAEHAHLFLSEGGGVDDEFAQKTVKLEGGSGLTAADLKVGQGIGRSGCGGCRGALEERGFAFDFVRGIEGEEEEFAGGGFPGGDSDGGFGDVDAVALDLGLAART